MFSKKPKYNQKYIIQKQFIGVKNQQLLSYAVGSTNCTPGHRSPAVRMAPTTTPGNGMILTREKLTLLQVTQSEPVSFPGRAVAQLHQHHTKSGP